MFHSLSIYPVALSEAKAIGNKMADEASVLTGGSRKALASFMKESIPDRMEWWDKLTKTEQKKLLVQIGKITWA